MKRLGFGLVLTVYTLVLCLAQPLLMLYLLKRAKKQPSYRQGWGQRFLANVPVMQAPQKPARRIWVHAVSVGETHAVSPLVQAWATRHPEDSWVFSSTTPTGQDTARLLFSNLNGAAFFYLPYDLPWLMRRCLARTQASQLWLVETELWPNLLRMAARANLAVCLLNARVSPRTGQRLKQLAWLSKPLLGALRCLVCQTQADAQVFEALGRPVDAVSGNLKFDVVCKPALIELGLTWKSQQAGWAVLLLASSREGEEALLLQALTRLRFFERLPRVSVWVVPRHPQRFDAVHALLEEFADKQGLGPVARRSQWLEGGPAPSLPRLVLGDSMGEMPAYYTVANVALLGGSWLNFGGQNLIEACACACPVWMGPHTYNFRKASEDALAAGAARRFAGLDEACETFLDEEARQHLLDAGVLAQVYAARHVGATQITLDAVLNSVDSQ